MVVRAPGPAVGARPSSQGHDRAVVEHLDVVVLSALVSPDHLAVAVELDQPLAFEDSQQRAVVEEVSPPPPMELAGVFFGGAEDLCVGLRPPMQHGPVHVHQRGLWSVATRVQIQPGMSRGAVHRDSALLRGHFDAVEVADGLQLCPHVGVGGRLVATEWLLCEGESTQTKGDRDGDS